MSRGTREAVPGGTETQMNSLLLWAVHQNHGSNGGSRAINRNPREPVLTGPPAREALSSLVGRDVSQALLSFWKVLLQRCRPWAVSSDSGRGDPGRLPAGEASELSLGGGGGGVGGR